MIVTFSDVCNSIAKVITETFKFAVVKLLGLFGLQVGRDGNDAQERKSKLKSPDNSGVKNSSSSENIDTLVTNGSSKSTSKQIIPTYQEEFWVLASKILELQRSNQDTSEQVVNILHANGIKEDAKRTVFTYMNAIQAGLLDHPSNNIKQKYNQQMTRHSSETLLVNSKKTHQRINSF